jgi:tetratricopeptide (TPR) repeat protein
MGFLLPVGLQAQINTDRVMAIGRNALYFEDYVLSIQYFNQVINARPYLAEPYFYRGLAKINLDDFEGAEVDCSESIERNPFMVNTYQVRGWARIRLGNLDGAVADYEKALTFDPENVGLWHNLALCRIRQKKFDEARTDLNQLLSVSPRYTKGFLMRAEVGLEQKDTLAAERDFNHAVDLDRYDPDTWSGRAMLRLQQERYKEAEEDLDQAVHLSVRNAGVYINRALARYHQNNLRGAMSDYDFALDVEPSNFIGHYNRGLLRAQVGDDNRAIEDFNFVIEMEPDNMMAIFNRALLLDQTGDLRAAEKDYTTVIDEYPNFWTGYQYRAQVRRKLGNLKGADADEFVLLKAQIDKMNGVKPAKKDDTRKKSDKNMDNYRKIVVADNEEADERYASAYRGRVQDKNVTITPRPLFALTYYERHDDVKSQVNYYKAIEELNARRVLPDRLKVTNEEAPLTEAQVSKHFASIDNYSARLDKHPDDVEARFARAIDFYLVQDFDAALEDLTEVIRRRDDFFLAYFCRSLIRSKQIEYHKMNDATAADDTEEGRLVKAVDYELVKRDLDKVVELAPDFVYGYYNRAAVLSTLKDYRGALADYDKVIQLDEKMADAYYNRGLTHIFLGNNRPGIHDLSQAGELGLFQAYNIIKRFTDRKEE